tara:strand:+ start:257 stop:616 length:360 start_codon:yes stop_codon:yes gene_type:complete
LFWHDFSIINNIITYLKKSISIKKQAPLYCGVFNIQLQIKIISLGKVIMSKNNQLTIRVIPQTYLKYGCIVITTGFRVFIDGKKFPKKRGCIYGNDITATKDNNIKKAKRLALKEFRIN